MSDHALAHPRRVIPGFSDRIRRIAVNPHANGQSDAHSTRQIEDSIGWAAGTCGQTLRRTVVALAVPLSFGVSESSSRDTRCPLLPIRSTDDQIQLIERAHQAAEAAGAERVPGEGDGNAPQGRQPASTTATAVQTPSPGASLRH